MRLFFTISLLIPFLSFGQTHIVTVSAGEYTSVGGGSDNLPICFSANAALVGISGATSGVPKEITGTGTTFTYYNTTLHGGNAIDATGAGWTWGNNTDGETGIGPGGIGSTTNAAKVTLDSRGVALANIVFMQGTYFQNGADDIAGLLWVKHGTASDTILYSGVGKYGMAADGSTGSTTYATPAMTYGLPSGQRVLQLIGGIVGAFLRTDQTVWTWGGGGNTGALGRAVSGSNYAVPIQVTIPGSDPIVQIVGGGNPGILYLGASGKLYGNSTNSGYMGNSGQTSYTTPTDLTTNITNYILNGTTRTSITSMGCTSLGFYIIANDGSLWYFGDNDMGGAGNGFQANLASPPGDSTPWFIDPSGVLYTPIYHPQQVGNKYNWTWVSSGTNFVFQVYAIDANNQLWSWGRNKGGVIPDGIIECPGDGGDLTAFYPNSWDRNWAYPVNPYTITTATGQGCYGCKTGAVTANCHSCGSTQTPVPSISLTGTTLDGTASHVGGSNVITKYVYSQISGPNTAVIDAPGSPIVHLSGLISGTYVMQLQVTDNFFDSATTTTNVVVGSQTGFYFTAAGSGTACTIGAPCPPSYINTVYGTAVAGDTLYLNRGDVFPVKMICNSSGSSGNPIVVKAYGTGKSPIIGGTTTLTGWTNVSGNVWSVPYTGTWPNLMIVNAKLSPYATTPNYTNSMFIPTSMSINTVTDATNAGNVQTDDTIIGRSSSFVYNKRKVSSNTGGVITVSANFTYSGVGGLGWFKWGDKPDTVGEWRDTANTIQIYSVGTPSGTYEVPTLDTCLLSAGTYQEFDSLHFKGASNANIILTFQAVSGVVFNGDTVSYGFDGMQIRSEGGMTVTNCHFLHMSDNGILKQNLNNYNNTAIRDSGYDIGMIRGMGGDGNASYFYSGFVVGDSGSVVKYCQVDSVGYHGIVNLGSGFTNDSSWVNHYCKTLVDGAAFYTWINTAPSFARQRFMRGNTASDGGGGLAANGCTNTISDQAFGFYLDSRSESITLSGNTSNQTVSGGFFVHGANNTLTGNHSYGSGYADLLVSEVAGETITGLSIKHNVWGSTTSTIPAVRFSTINNDLSTFGVSDSNQVAGNLIAVNPYWTFSSVDAGTFRTPAGWTSNVGYDSHTTFQIGQPYFIYNGSGTNSTQYLPGGFIDLNGNKYSGNTTLAPYNSRFMFSFSIAIPIPRGNRIIVL